MSDLLTLPKLTGFPDLTWRAARLEDAAAIRQLSKAAVAIDELEAPQPVEEIEQVFALLGDEAATDSLLALDADGNVAAMAFVFMLPPNEDERLIRLGGSVHVKHRGRGIGTYLMTWMEARARQKVAGTDDGLITRALINCREQHTDRITLFEQQGFRATRYFYKMKRDLMQPIPEKTLLPELTLTTWTPDLDMETREAFNKSFRDHFGFAPFEPEMWQQLVSGGPHFRGDLTYLAQNEDGQVVGFLVSEIDESRNVGRDKSEAIMGQIGVIRGWRKQGIASALIAEAMRAYRVAGIDYAVLGVDTENPSGALRLYENLGFEAVQRSIAFEKELT